MKLAALYSVWNGLELLDGSIKQIYDHVDLIVISWQLYSNKGERSDEIQDFISKYDDPKIHIIEFHPDPDLNTKQNEMAKLQQRIDYAKLQRCTHFFSSATDHYYDPKQFVKARDFCYQEDYDVTFTAMYTYYKDPTWRVDPREEYYMPFICRLYPHTKVMRMPSYPVKVDPSIQISTCERSHLFSDGAIIMHHYSMIRQDIENKFRNAAAFIRWSPEKIQQHIQEYENAKPGDTIAYFGGRVIVEVPNLFDI